MQTTSCHSAPERPRMPVTYSSPCDTSRRFTPLRREYDQDAAELPRQPQVSAQPPPPPQSNVAAESGQSSGPRQRPFLLSHARIHRDDAHPSTALLGAARSGSPAGRPASAAAALFGCSAGSRPEPALLMAACRRLREGSPAVTAIEKSNDVSCSGVTAAYDLATERRHNAGVPPSSGAPALVSELRRLASLRRLQGAQTASRGTAGPGPAALPAGHAAPAVHRSDQTSAAGRMPAQSGQPAQSSSQGRRVDGTEGPAPSSTLASELRALRARPPRSKEPAAAGMWGRRPDREEGPSARAAVAAQAVSDVLPRMAQFGGTAPARDAGCLAQRSTGRSVGCQPRPIAVQMQETHASVPAQTASGQPAGDQATPKPVFDGIRAVFDPNLEPSQAARCALEAKM